MTQGGYVIVDANAEWVVPTLIKHWRAGKPPFDFAEPVPARLPTGMVPKSLEHIKFLFQGLPWMRGRIDSAEAYKRLVRVYEKYPHILDLEMLAAIEDPENEDGLEIRQILINNGLGVGVQQAVEFWILNARKLVRFWGGNPFNIFWGVRNYDELCNRFIKGKREPDTPTGFLGIRHKMVSMIIYFFERAGITDLKYEYPGPFDSQNIRILTCTESIVIDGGWMSGSEINFYRISPVGRELYFRFCKTKEDTLDLADALWYLSRMWCSQSQGNATRRVIFYDDNGKKKVQHIPKQVVWSKERIEHYHNTCAQCPIESRCKWSLPMSANYERSTGSERLSIRGPRPKPPVLQERLALEVPRVRPRREQRLSRVLPVLEQIEEYPSFLDQPLT